MKDKQDPHQGVLMGLEAPDGLRHPMWTPPSKDERLEVPVRALREAIARSMIAFDGREDYASVVIFAERVYRASTMGEMLTSNAYWLVGKVMAERDDMLRGLDRALKVCQPATQHLYRAEIPVIERLGLEWVKAILDAVRG